MDLSIIIPVYNVELFLERCLESVTSIKGIKYECIIVNDGSTDNSRSIIDKFSHLSILKIVDKKNEGLSEARNVGLSIATGEYISFIDSDDFIDPIEYVKLFNTGRKFNPDIIVGDFFYYYSDKKIENSQYSNIFNELKVFHSNSFYINNSKQISSVVWRNIYKHKFLDDNSLTFHKGVYFEDVEWTCLFYSKKPIVCYLPLSFYYYRQREGSIMKSMYSLKHLNDALIIQEIIFENARIINDVNIKRILYENGMYIFIYTAIKYNHIIPSPIWNKFKINVTELRYLSSKWKFVVLLKNISPLLCYKIIRLFHK